MIYSRTYSQLIIIGVFSFIFINWLTHISTYFSFTDELFFLFIFISGITLCLYDSNCVIKSVSYHIYFLLFFVFVILNTEYNNDVIKIYKDYLSIPLLIYFTLIFGISFELKKTLLYIKFASVILFLAAVIGLIYPITELAIVYHSNDGPSSLRVGSFLVNPNTLAYTCVLFLIVIICSGFKIRFNDALVILMLLFLIIITNSRSAFLLTILFIFTYFFLIKKSINSLYLIPLIFLFIYIIGLLVSYFSPDFLTTRTSSLSRIFLMTGRLDIWNSYLDNYEVSIINFLFGNGLGFYSRSNSFNNVIDSYYLKIFLEAGAIGLIIYFYTFIYLTLKNIKMYLNGNDPVYLIKSFVGTFTILIGFVSTVWDIFPLYYFLYIVFFLTPRSFSNVY